MIFLANKLFHLSLQGENAQFVYELEDKNEAFRITQDGSIKVQKDLDREQTYIYEFKVRTGWAKKKEQTLTLPFKNYKSNFDSLLPINPGVLCLKMN